MRTSLKKRVFEYLIMSLSLILIQGYSLVYATDTPHREPDGSDDSWCLNCHVSHTSAPGQFTRLKGNSNVCQSCHALGERAENKVMASADLAVPGSSGRTHRWDSGPAGYVTASVSNTSTGTVLSGISGFSWNSGDIQGSLKNIAYNGTVVRTYEINIMTSGESGVAQFQWRKSDDGGATWSSPSGNLATGANITITDGTNIKFSFINGSSTTSFVAGDKWTIVVRPQINFPFNSDLAKRMFTETNATMDVPDVTSGDLYIIPSSTYGKAACSTCHNQHGQSKNSFDPYASVYTSGGGEGRHFQRMDNEQNQMCLNCHSQRNIAPTGSITNVETWQGVDVKLSHPVGVDYATGTGSNIPTMHMPPKEPSTTTTPGTDQINLSLDKLFGTATADSGNLTTLTDTTKGLIWTTNELAGKMIRFVYKRCNSSCPTNNLSVGISVTIASNTNTTITFSTSLTNQIRNGDAYVIDVDGNPSNDFRFYNAGTISFTGGTVYCMTCHGPHWADSNELTYDAP